MGVVDGAEDEVEDEEHGDVQCLSNCRRISQQPGKGSNVVGTDDGWIDEIRPDSIEDVTHEW